MKILYVCTHNRCRSILCEAITNLVAGPGMMAASAGSQPEGQVHPLTLQYLREAGVPTVGLHSKSWDALEDFEPDLVITVCDSAANESCPAWFGKAVKVHWGLADPSKVQGDADAQAQAFRACIAEIKQRATALRDIARLHPDGELLRAALLRLGASA
ncbi:MAG: arsenate reductase ArsC [Pseudohongiellaceae bacterium]